MNSLCKPAFEIDGSANLQTAGLQRESLLCVPLLIVVSNLTIEEENYLSSVFSGTCDSVTSEAQDQAQGGSCACVCPSSCHCITSNGVNGTNPGTCYLQTDN